jgi:hypothetical protein
MMVKEFLSSQMVKKTDFVLNLFNIWEIPNLFVWFNKRGKIFMTKKGLLHNKN